MKIHLTTEEKNQYIERIQNFFLNERDEDLGIIAASTILDFFIDEIGADMFNKGVDETKTYMSRKIDDMMYDIDEVYK